MWQFHLRFLNTPLILMESGSTNIRSNKISWIRKKKKFYQAGMSEMFGKVVEILKVKTPFYPKALMVSQSLCTLDYCKLWEV